MRTARGDGEAPNHLAGGAGALHADAAPGVPGRTITLLRSVQGAASARADDHPIELRCDRPTEHRRRCPGKTATRGATTALVNGVFALLALLVGAVVLVRPAFGAPADRPQPAWVRAVALAGVALGVLGVLISAGMYLDLFVSLPSAGTPAGG
ncbi:hypothetical protein YW5DRAFT_03935 [Streptomyces sp. Ncost-T6T-1]|nr:hypothetical protein YW5DRAFT_03935 [Streptomyces sp. Ncost-T6T-1]